MADTLAGARDDLSGDVHAGPRHPAVERLFLVGRNVFAVVLAGFLGGILWLIVMQKALAYGYTDHSFNAAMGLTLGATEEQISREGFYATMVVWLVLAVAFDPMTRLWRAPWWQHALPLGAVVFLLWGAVFGPLAAGRQDEVPAGLFGADAGSATVVVALVAAAVAALTVARVHALVRSAEWWEPKHFDLRESLEQLFAQDLAPTEPAGRPPASAEQGRDVTRHPPLQG